MMWRILVLAATLLLGGCASLPTGYERTPTQAIQDTATTRLGRETAAVLAAHPRSNGFLPLPDGTDALVMRLYLASAAERSLDLMYYIWHDDLSGRHLADAVLRAADRGVRVRLLLDDLGVGADDAVLLALDAHPNIEVRLFNPIALRGLRGWGTLVDFGRLNRRMHNKALIADNQRAVLGGRNIGDEYFGANREVAFGDLDVVFAGPLVADTSAVFDQFWNAPVSYPIAALTGQPGDLASLDSLRSRLAAFVEAERDGPVMTRLRSEALELRETLSERLYWGPGHVLADDPLKVTRPPEDAEGRLLPKFAPLGLAATRELLVVSPYFVPGDPGVAWLTGLVRKGVRVTVLTNSLASNDVSAVHAGYSRYREALLEGGVRLYELRPQAIDVAREKSKQHLVGSSRASLHAKTFMVDRKAIFIGSLNLDPRSVHLNTEIGVVCESPAMVQALAGPLEQALDRIAWRLERETDASGTAKLVWIERTADGGELRRDTEPEAGVWRRISAWFIGLLPIESQL